MAGDRPPLAEPLAEAGDGDFPRGAAEAVARPLVEADVEGVVGAGRHGRSAGRQTCRDGFRDRALDTRLGARSRRWPSSAPR